MKKTILFISLIFNILYAFSQQIPDANFAQAIRYTCPECIDDGNRLTPKAAALKTLVVSIQKIRDLTGVEGFSNLSSLNCESNLLTTLPNLPSTLTSLNFSYNQITEIKNLPTGLVNLRMIGNKITKLPALPNNLQILNCSNNPITELPPLPANLNTLFCEHTMINKLPILPAKLEGLMCNDNRLKNIPTLPKILIRLSCQNNPDLTCLPLLPPTLEYLDISKQIICLPNTPTKAEINIIEGITYKPVANIPVCTPIQAAYCPPLENEKKTEIDIFKVYPNPTEGELTIKVSPQNFKKISIFNSNGKLMLESSLPISDISSLAAGIYFIKVETIEDTYINKIVRQ
jgi:hypothetical protein